MDPDLEQLLRIWKTRYRLMQSIPNTGANRYELKKCIETLEDEIKYEEGKNDSQTG